MSKSAAVKSVNLPAQPLEESFRLTSLGAQTAAWKQEINQKLAAHRTRRGESQEAAGQAASSEDGGRSASGRAQEAAARVAARYAKAPSYKQLLAGEARAVVRAAGAAAEAARSAQAAAQAVLTGLEFGPLHGEGANDWQPAPPNPSMATAQPAPARWQDQPPAELHLTAAELAWREYEAIHGPQHFPAANSQAAPQSPAQAGAKPRWEETLPLSSSSPALGNNRDAWSEMRLHPSPNEGAQYRSLQDDLHEYDSHDPMGDATVEPMQHLSANLIEFPKELVAARKARPRQAEGPYYDASKEDPQLSIFEVDPDLLAPPICLSDTTSKVAPPEWASIQLGQQHRSEPEGHADSRYVYAKHESIAVAEQLNQPEQGHYEESVHPPVMPSEQAAGHTRLAGNSGPTGLAVEPAYQDSPATGKIRATETRTEIRSETRSETRSDTWEAIAKLASAPKLSAAVQPVAHFELLQVAPVRDRILAAVIDGALVTLAFLAAAMVVVASTTHPPAGRVALAASVFGLLLFGLLYQFLFFSYAEEGTPGMRYARIALCSFEDDNPCREQVRKRIPALLLSALPAGLGLAWAFVDGDGLAWHDRMTRTYQRKY